METKAFLIRVAICFLLSLIPATDIENRIYSARMELRGNWARITDVVIVNADNPGAARARLRELQPRLILTVAGDPFNDFKPDSDGVVRRVVLLGKSGPSIAYQALQAVRPEAARPSRRAGPHLINYAGEAGRVARCSLGAGPGRATCPDLRDRIVLLADPADDALFRTPLGEMSRTEILANDINTVVHRHRIYQASWIERSLLTLLLILIGAFYIIYYPVLISAIAVSGTGIGVVIVLFQVVFQLFSVYIPSFNIGSSLLFTYLIFTGYRLAFQENLQWRSLKQAQYLRELEQMKSNFLSLVSHDLKTPISKIQAVVERMRRELQLPAEERPNLEEWKELLESVDNSNNELKHYISSILNLSKIESQKVILNKKSNDINLLIQQALKRLSPLAHQKNIRIEKTLDPLFSVECDEDLMRQVLTNLVDNAIKYSPQNSKVLVRSREEDGCIRVEVEDFGPGIPKDQLPLTFRKFNRFLRPLQAQVKGTGLGLYLSKYFIELHGGRIQVRSVEGKGTTFTFILPLQESRV